MKRIFLALSLCCSLHLSAENVPQDKARQMAEEFLLRSRSRAGAVHLRMVYDGETSASRSSGQAPALYVFDNEGRNGFVVVSGDDATHPILGYSFDGDFPEGQLPANLQWWLDEMKNQVNYLREQGAPTLSSSRADEGGEVVVKLNTAKWDQDAPFNKQSPRVGGKQSPTGCTATALAIVMHYLQWPQKRTVEIPGYKTKTNKLSISARPPGTDYQWDQMLLEYKQGTYTEYQANLVAQLMADVAVMLKSDFGSNSTSALDADVPISMATYMDYDKSARLLRRYCYSQAEWYKLMKDELDGQCPVFYAGSNDKAGHAFVLDGYTSNDYFSVNWGWEGYCDGYFRLDALTPHGSGTGGNNEHYNSQQSAVVGLKKNEGGDWAAATLNLGEKGFTKVPKTFRIGVPFSITVDYIWCTGNGYFTGSLLWAVTDKEGAIKHELAVFPIDNPLQIGYAYYDWTFEFTIRNAVSEGDRLCLFYKPTGASEWTLMQGGEETVWEVVLSKEVSLEEETSVHFTRSTGILLVQSKEGVQIQLVDQSGKEVTTGVESNSYGVRIDTNQLPASTYTLKLSLEEKYHELKLKMGLSK